MNDITEILLWLAVSTLGAVLLAMAYVLTH